MMSSQLWTTAAAYLQQCFFWETLLQIAAVRAVILTFPLAPPSGVKIPATLVKFSSATAVTSSVWYHDIYLSAI